MKAKTPKVNRPKSQFFNLDEIEDLSSSMSFSDQFYTCSETVIDGVSNVETAIVSDGKVKFLTSVSKNNKVTTKEYFFDSKWRKTSK